MLLRRPVRAFHLQSCSSCRLTWRCSAVSQERALDGARPFEAWGITLAEHLGGALEDKLTRGGGSRYRSCAGMPPRQGVRARSCWPGATGLLVTTNRRSLEAVT